MHTLVDICPLGSTDVLTSTPGLSLRELVYELRYQTLVLFKCLLLQKRVRIIAALLRARLM